MVQDEPWILTGELLGQVETDASGAEVLPVDERVLRRLQEEDERRTENRTLIAELKAKDASLAGDPILARWERESQPLPTAMAKGGGVSSCTTGDGGSGVGKRHDELAQRLHRITILKGRSTAIAALSLTAPSFHLQDSLFWILPLEVALFLLRPYALGTPLLRMRLNPVATVILYATLDYPARFGPELSQRKSSEWGQSTPYYYSMSTDGVLSLDRQPLPREERAYSA